MTAILLITVWIIHGKLFQSADQIRESHALTSCIFNNYSTSERQKIDSQRGA